MNNERLEHFRKKLESEKKRVYSLLKQMEENETINSNAELSTELSFYDNHPSDIATEIFDKERGIAFKGNELSIIKKIENSLSNIDKGTYGKCSICGKDIKEERLEFIPYTDHCVECQKWISNSYSEEKKNTPIEKQEPGYPFGYGYNDRRDEVGFDAEDSYQAVGRFNRIKNVIDVYSDEDEDYVEPIERISNEQYKNQLP
ncbi:MULTISPECIES: TraR/DksA C4-type zinc finger protein [Clostridium]|uniref:Transcriptional regulator, TraR/DksA family n=2 Tax=Clostridium TaxID=1485 RepID=A0A0E3M7D2_CLOSL|nr:MULTISPECIES: TraR/DksA C4-type zinc finger protein [Clostridium]AKA70228.1 transcriptional regulator, TraR/DksA family [Clostridium scatologenes]AWI03754.1 molecular chaperone DnaK [Clostridium drakei]